MSLRDSDSIYIMKHSGFADNDCFDLRYSDSEREYNLKYRDIDTTCPPRRPLLNRASK